MMSAFARTDPSAPLDRDAVAGASSAIPVTVITGFLGSGKTTLLNELLSRASLRDTAVLVNEFGAVGIDHLLVRSVDERVLLLDGGCVCCSILGDATAALLELADKRARGEVPAFSRVLVETTGLADPVPLLRTVLANEAVAQRYETAGVITVVDAEQGAATLAQHRESVSQVATADRLVMSKCDRADEARVEALAGLLRELNPVATLVYARREPEATGARVQLSVSTEALLEPVTTRSLASSLARVTPLRIARRVSGPARHAHGDTLRSRAVVFDGPVRWRSFVLWLSLLTQMHGESVLRLKAILQVEGEEGPVVVHAAQHVVHPAEPLESWPTSDRRCRVVLITRGLDERFLDDVESSLRDACAPRP